MQKIITAIPDAMIVAGGIAIAIGAGLLHIAAGFIVGGVLAIAGGVLASMKPSKAVE